VISRTWRVRTVSPRNTILRDFKPQPGENYPFGGPLLFDPGERWHYGTSTDVVGKLVEKVSGQKLEDYFCWAWPQLINLWR
jgi:CubicO group peptidase (beta-lactamase class C family)